jgi:uncharacterized protein (TIGR03000 family)
MFRQIFARSNLTVLALLGTLLVAEPAAAQRFFNRNQGSTGWTPSPTGSYYNGNYGGNYGGFDYSTPNFYSSPGYYTNPNFSNVPMTGYQSYFPQGAGQVYGYYGTNAASNAFGGARAVLINVALPPNAEISFEDSQTRQNGVFRQFISPPLIPGQEYAYKVDVNWSENGTTVTRTRRITVHAGDIVNLVFNADTNSSNSSSNSSDN